MTKYKVFIRFIVFLLLTSCATYGPQYETHNNLIGEVPSEKKIDKTFFLIGDAGNSDSGESSFALEAYKKYIDTKGKKNDYAIFLGDNIYEKGLPPKNHKDRSLAEHRLNVQVNSVKDFKGDVLFIPGNHDWYTDGLKGLKRQEEYLEEALDDKNVFQPEKGCPIEKIDVSDEIVLLVLDTQWYLTDWEKHPTMNDNCEIKSKNDFFLEIEGQLKKNNEKTILIAMHHPAYTNGPHGGAFNWEKHLFPTRHKIPMPGLGTLVSQIRAQGGVSPQDISNPVYNKLMKRLITFSQGSDRVIFVSGHEHSLQYVEGNGIKQIVSGAGSKRSAAAMGEYGEFSYGGQGFAVLDVFKDGSSEVRYYSAKEGKSELLFKKEVYPPKKEYDVSNLPKSFDSQTLVSAYEKVDTYTSKGYNWLWGDHYRYVYGTDLKVPVATLDTLMGGFTIARKGGGHQSRSLRLLDKDGKNYALRAVKKSAVQFLQSVAFKDNYIEDDFKETLTEDVLFDFYTSSHPYATFTVNGLADAIGVYHTNPKLLYIPKHAALGKYNEEFGNELYILEERPDDDFVDVESFGKPDGIESTSDVFKNLRKDEKYQIDEAAFIKARLFDMLLGDWDRHQDQWRWARFDISEDKKIYRPIPRDRDQAFSNYDGALLDILKIIIPPTKQFQKYSGSMKELKWLNSAGIKIDRAFTQNSTREDWIAQAKYIQENLTDADVDAAFMKVPAEVQDEILNGIKAKLKSRKSELADAASRYYDRLAKLIIVTGTDKDDRFEVTRKNGSTLVEVFRIKGGESSKPFKSREVNSEETQEIWLFGLDDDDQFNIGGDGNNPIFTRVVGGQNNDVYNIENGKKIKVFDHKSKPNTIIKNEGAAIRFNDIYTNNTYDSAKYIDRINNIIPSIGSNPDDGFRIGLQDSYTVKGFKNDPYHRKHILKGVYYFATQGFDVKYIGEFANTFGSWNLLAEANFASENFTQNFFGFGNETTNLDKDLTFDYNRVKTGILSGRVGLVKNGHNGSRLALTTGVEKIEAERSEDRFISDFFSLSNTVFDSNVFGIVDVTYNYKNADNGAFPTRGMTFIFQTGLRSNFNDLGRTYGYVNPSIEFFNALSKDKKFVLYTKAKAQFNLGNDYEFYQAANLGADKGLRGFRNQRFSGKTAFVFGGDLRYSIMKFRTGLLPLKLGVFGGMDVGRVWINGDNSQVWHNDFGGGLILNAVDAVSGQFGIFNGGEGLRVSFGFGVSI